MHTLAGPPRQSTPRPRWGGAVRRTRRRLFDAQPVVLASLVGVAFLCAALTLAAPDVFPPALLVSSLLLGGLLLTWRSLLVLLAVVVLILGVEVGELGLSDVPPGSFIVVGVVAAFVLWTSRGRLQLGLHGQRGESMLVDLRDRLVSQGEMPVLPPGWEAEVVLRSAGGASFSGDFLVSTRPAEGRHLELALVDVSGKGVGAGTRALLLSGAFGGLLGAMPSGEFLPAANTYVCRQGWDEGFATAVHVDVDLESGEFVLRSAGHPPAVQFHSSRGEWRVAGSRGLLLGVVPGARYDGEPGRLDRGDALLLYTDGLVEVPGRDISLGLDRLLGEAERLVTQGFRDGARRLVDAVGDRISDDRALVLLWRV